MLAKSFLRILFGLLVLPVYTAFGEPMMLSKGEKVTISLMSDVTAPGDGRGYPVVFELGGSSSSQVKARLVAFASAKLDDSRVLFSNLELKTKSKSGNLRTFAVEGQILDQSDRSGLPGKLFEWPTKICGQTTRPGPLNSGPWDALVRGDKFYCGVKLAKGQVATLELDSEISLDTQDNN